MSKLKQLQKSKIRLQTKILTIRVNYKKLTSMLQFYKKEMESIDHSILLLEIQKRQVKINNQLKILKS